MSAEPARFDAEAAAAQIQQQTLAFDLPEQHRTSPAHHTDARRPPAAEPDGLLPTSLTDRGNAKLFARLYRDQFRYVIGMGWHSWDEYRWKLTGGDEAAVWAAGEMAEQIADHDPQGTFTPASWPPTAGTPNPPQDSKPSFTKHKLPPGCAWTPTSSTATSTHCAPRPGSSTSGPGHCASPTRSPTCTHVPRS